jgi:hypothetical protein
MQADTNDVQPITGLERPTDCVSVVKNSPSASTCNHYVLAARFFHVATMSPCWSCAARLFRRRGPKFFCKTVAVHARANSLVHKRLRPTLPFALARGWHPTPPHQPDGHEGCPGCGAMAPRARRELKATGAKSRLADRCALEARSHDGMTGHDGSSLLLSCVRALISAKMQNPS